MSVQYTAIGYNNNLLVHAGQNQKLIDTFQSQVDSMFTQFQNKGDLRTSNNEDSKMNFYVCVTNDVVCICFTDKYVTKQQAYGMCNEILTQFSNRYPADTLKFAQRLQCDREFSGVIKNQMQNIGRFTSKVQELQKELENVKGLVMDNINAVMKRANQLEDIENDAADLREAAGQFKDNSKALKNQMRCKQITIICGVVAGIIILLLVIIVPLCI